MKSINQLEWSVVQLGNGKFAPRVATEILGSYWPFEGCGEYDTFEQAKEVLLNRKLIEEEKAKNRKEKVVFSIV